MKCNMNLNLNPFLTNTARKVSVFRVFLVCIFPHSDGIRRDTPYLPVFSPNVRKHEPEKPRTRTLFPQCNVLILYHLETPKKKIGFLVFSEGHKMETMTRNELMTYKVSNLNNIKIFRNQITSSVFPEMNKNIPQVSR